MNKIYIYYKIDLTQVLKVRLEVTPLKSLGREFVRDVVDRQERIRTGG